MKPVSLLAALLVPIVACTDGEGPPNASSAPRAASVASVFEGTPAPASQADEPAMVERGFGLARLPASTLFAARVVSVRGNSEEWSRLAMTKAVDSIGGWSGLLGDAMGALRQEITNEVPGGETLLAAVEEIGGEAVLALTEIYPEVAMSSRGEMPFSLAAFVELEGGGASLREYLDTLVDDPALGSEFERAGDDGYRSTGNDASVEMRFAEGRLCVWMGPESKIEGALDALLSQEASTSFLGSSVVRQAPTAGADETPWLEAFVQLESVWKTVDQFAPREARTIIDGLRLQSIEGLSFVSSLDGDSFHDRATLHTSGDDIVSALLDHEPIERSWARFVFAGADTGGVISFSPSETLNRVKRSLPAIGRRQLAEAIGEFRQATGKDLVGDILDRFGPHWVHGSRGDIASAMQDAEDFEAFVAIEVRDADELEEMLDGVFQSGMLPIAPRPRETQGVKFQSIAVPLPEGPAGIEPSYGFVGGALVIASSGDTFVKVVAAHQSGGKATPAWLRTAFDAADMSSFVVTAGQTEPKVRGFHSLLRTAQEDSGEAWPYLPTVAQVDAFTKDLPPEWSVARRVANGFLFESRSPFGSALISAAPLAIVAAIAIPNLLSARLSANEESTIARLRNLQSAQEQFRALAAADRDQDRQGEFGTLGELSGATPLPDGSLLHPPVLSQAFAFIENGGAERSGYVVRLALPGKDGEPVGELENGGAPDGVDTRMAEQMWLAYAYPVKPGSTGTRVFFIDQTGHILFTTNDAPGQGYGPGNPPAFDAAFAADDRPMSQGGHVGRDGGFWTLAY